MIIFPTDVDIKVAEFVNSGSVVEVFEKKFDKIFYDIVCASETIDSERRLDCFIPTDRISPLVISIVSAMEYISNQHKKLRQDTTTSDTQSVWPGCKRIVSDDTKYQRFREFKKGSVIVEVFKEKSDFFIRCCTEFMSKDSRVLNRSAMIQQRDLRNLISVVVESQIFISKFAEDTFVPEDNFGNTSNIKGGFF